MRLAVALVLLAVTTGSEASMAKIRSSYKDTSILHMGADRSAVIEQLGSPDASANLARGGHIEIYRIDPNAHTDQARRAAIISHTLLTFMTYGLWEFIGTPFELAVNDRFLTYVLSYDQTNKLARLKTVRFWNPPTITDDDKKSASSLLPSGLWMHPFRRKFPLTQLAPLSLPLPHIRSASKRITGHCTSVFSPFTLDAAGGAASRL